MKQTTRITNRENFYRQGRAARAAGRPLDDCPQLSKHVGDSYGQYLMRSWLEGWQRQDEEIRQGQLFKQEVSE